MKRLLLLLATVLLLETAVFFVGCAENDGSAIKDISPADLAAANAELHQAKVAIDSAMLAGGVSKIDQADGAMWDGSASQISAGGVDAHDYISGVFKARYKINKAGDIAGADLSLPQGRTSWSGITWDTAHMQWKKA